MLATDGNPTGRTDGNQYDPSQWQNTLDERRLDLRPGAARRLRPADRAAHDRRCRAATTTSRPTSSAWATRSPTRARSPRSTRWPTLGGGYPTAFLGSSADSLQRAFQDDRRRHPGEDQRGLVGGAQHRLVDDRLGAVPGQVQQRRLVGQRCSTTPSPAAARSARRATWDAGAQIKAQNWNTGRAILTYKPSAAAGAHGIPFRWPAAPATPTATELDASQIAALNLTPGGGSDAFGEQRLRFLRGDAELRVAQLREPAVRRAAVQEPRHLAARRRHQLVAVLRRRAELRLLRRLRGGALQRVRRDLPHPHAGDLHGRQRRHAACDQRDHRRRDVRLRAVAGVRPTCRS